MTRRFVLCGCLCLLWTGAGCDGDPEDAPPLGPLRLVNPFDWSPLAAADDPFAAHRPADVTCPDDSWGGEPFGAAYSLEIQTGDGQCHWFSAAQPIQGRLAAGDPIRIRVWHFDLFADERGEAHVALAIGGVILWERRVVIPSPGGLLLDTVEAPRAWSAGTPLVFHLHNHGANTWNLVEVVARPDAGDAGPP